MKARIPLLLALAVASTAARAEEPSVLLSHQGRLLDGTDVPVNIETTISVGLYASKDALKPEWSESYTVHPVNGAYAVLLGEAYGNQQKKALPAAALKGERWVGVTIGTTELLPRQRIGVAPQAVSAFNADEATHAAIAEKAKDLDCAGCVKASLIANGAVGEAHVADGAVSTRTLGAGAVTEAKLADGSISARTVAAKAVGEAALGDGAVSTRTIAAKAVTEGNLADGSISARTVSAKAIGEAALGDAAVSTRTIAAKAVTEANLADGSISARTVSAKAIGEAALGDGAVSTRTIAGKGVTEPAFADQAVSTRALADGSVTPAKLAGNIDATKLSDNAVATAKLADGAVTNAKLAANAVNTAQLADGAITAAKLSAGAAGTNENLLHDTLGFGAFARGDLSGIGVNGSGGYYPWNYFAYDTAAVKVERFASNDGTLGDVRGAIGWDAWWGADFTVLKITWGPTGATPGRLLQAAQNAQKNGPYTMSAYVRMLSGEAQMGMEQGGLVPVRSTTWTRVTSTSTASGTLGGAFGFAAKANSTGAVMLIALPKLEGGAQATPWRDGDQWCPDPVSIYRFGMCIWHVGNYDKTFRQATAACLSNGGHICTGAELQSAWAAGAEWCSCGWTSVGANSVQAYYPMQRAVGGCGSSISINACGSGNPGETWGANCCKTFPN